MGRFKLVKTISLEGIGDGWGSDTHMRFKVLSTDESAKLADQIKPVSEDEEKLTAIFRTALKDMFIDGKVFIDGEGVVDAERDDVEDLPKGVIIEAWTQINGSVYSSPKA